MHSKKKAILLEEQDPDILQISDELNNEWTDSWKKALNDPEQSGLTFLVHHKTEKIAQKKQH
jgi:hypothetical protein